MRRQFWLTGLALVLLSGTAPVRGQDVKDALGIIPADALAFALVNRVDQVNDKAMAMAKKLKMPLPLTPLDLAKALGVSKGLNTKGTAAAVMLAADGPPVPLLLLPVSDYQEFLKGFKAKGTGIVEISFADKKLAVAGKGKFALLVPSENKDSLKAILAAKGNLSVWAVPVSEWLEGNDIAFVATPLGIKQGVLAAGEGFATVKALAGGNDELAFMKGWIEGLESFLKTAQTDVTHAAVGIKIDEASNLTIDVRSLFAKGGTLAKSSADIKTLPGGPLANLPAGPYAVAFGGTMPPGFMESLSKMVMEATKLGAKQAGADLPLDKLKKLEQSYGSLYKGMNGMNFVLRSSKEKASLIGGMVATISSENSTGYLQNYEKMLMETNALYKELNLPILPQTKLEKKKLGKLSVLEATTDMAALNDDPMQKKIMEAMYGQGGKMTVSQAALDAKTVLSTYTNAAGLQQMIQSIKKGALKDDTEVARTLGMLPKDAQWVLLLNPRGLTTMAKQMVDTFAPGAVQIPDFPVSPPVGVGAKLSESGFQLQIVVPAQVLEGIGALIKGGDA